MATYKVIDEKGRPDGFIRGYSETNNIYIVSNCKDIENTVNDMTKCFGCNRMKINDFIEKCDYLGIKWIDFDPEQLSESAKDLARLKHSGIKIHKDCKLMIRKVPDESCVSVLSIDPKIISETSTKIECMNKLGYKMREMTEPIEKSIWINSIKGYQILSLLGEDKERLKWI